MSTATTTETPNSSKGEAAERPSVLTELGLGNDAPAVTEVPDAAPSTPGPGVETVAPAVAPAPVVEPPKPEGKSEGKPDAPAKDADDKTVAQLEKRVKETRDQLTTERQFTREARVKIDHLSQQIAVLTKKFDGTYDETKDAPKAEDPSVAAAKAVQAERVKASHWAAVDRYGEEYVMKTIWADDAPFRQFDGDEAVQARVFSAKVPILEAIKVVKEAEAKAKYGADPESMRKAIEQEVRASLEAEVRQKVLKELKQGTPIETIKGLGGVSSVGSHAPDQKPALSFESLFPNFVKAG